jgi:probable HAF family extracellular repeat protein
MSTVADSLTHAFVRAPGLSGAIRDLAGLDVNGRSTAFGVNSSGIVVGSATTADGARHAVSWSSGGTIQDLGMLAGDVESEARAINDAGQVVGWSRNRLGVPRGFIWTATTGMRPLDAVAQIGPAFAINQAGVVAGQDGHSPYLWSVASGYRRLAVLPGDAGGNVVAISNAGEMVGTSSGCADADYYDDCDWQPNGCGVLSSRDCAPTTDHPVLWVGSNPPVDLRSTGFFSSVAGINASRQVIGDDGIGRAVLWSAAGARYIGTLPNRTESRAAAINDSGLVVGWSANR